MMRHEQTPGVAGGGPDPLDALLEQATWPEIEPERVARVRQTCRPLMGRHATLVWRPLAATVLILILPVTALHHSSQRQRTVSDLGSRRGTQPSEFTPNGTGHSADDPAQTSGPALVNVQPSLPPAPAVAASKIEASTTAGLEPSNYQSAAMLARQRQPILAPAARKGQPSELELAIRAIQADPTADAKQLLLACLRKQPDCEQAVATLLVTSTGPRHNAAAKALMAIATRRSLPLLLQLRQQPDHRLAATRAVASLATAAELVELAQAEPATELQREFIQALARGTNSRHMELYLALVQHPRTSRASLDVASTLSPSCVNMLFDQLQSAKISTRMAAARALGSVNRAEVSDRLAAYMVRNVSRREAIVGLLSSAEPRAIQILAMAQQDLGLAATIRAARNNSHRYTN